MAEVAITQRTWERDELVALICERAIARWAGVDPYAVAAIYALAQLETGGAPLNNNFGNLIATSETQPYWVPPWVRDESHELHGVPGIPDKFRAYASPEEGMDALLSLLERRYPAALEAATAGDFRAFSAELLAAGYCPDCSPERHADTIDQLAGNVVSLQVVERVCGITRPPPGERENLEWGSATITPPNGWLTLGLLAIPAAALGVLLVSRPSRAVAIPILGVAAALNVGLVATHGLYTRRELRAPA